MLRVLPLLLSAPLASLLGPASAGAQDPFGPGLVWTVQAPLAEPWIPTAASFAAGDGLVWAAGAVGNPRLLAIASEALGPQEALFVDTGVDGVVGSFVAATAHDAEGLFSLVQRPAPDPLHRRTEVSRYDPLAAAAGAPFAPVWTIDLGLLTNGPARLAVEEGGERVVVAFYDDASAVVRLFWIDARRGAVLRSASFAAPNLLAFALSRDGQCAAVVAGAFLRVFDEQGQLLHAEPLVAPTRALALDADGAHLAYGDGPAVRLLERGAGGWMERMRRDLPPGELPLVVALSADGGTLAYGAWNATTGDDVRLAVHAGAGMPLRWEAVQTRPPGAFQNAPAAVRVTADGRRAAFALWGDGTSAPEIVLVDVPSASVPLAVDLPGSALALDLDRDGTRLVVAMKSVHANQFGSTGEVRLYASGERDLVQRAPARHGGTLELSARYPGALVTFFAIGRRTVPAPFPGAAGNLAIERSRRTLVLAAVPDETGRADLSLPLPGGAGMIGLDLAAQAAWRLAGSFRLGQTVLDLLVL